MKIKKLELQNFQGIKALTLDFDGKNAKIYGDNGTGKTTVYNAFAWLLFDRPANGAKGFNPKTKGENGDIHHLENIVCAELISDDGRIYSLKKVFKEVWRRIRGTVLDEFSGHTTDYFVDGVPVKEKEYLSTVELLCGDEEKGKLLTLPDYFSEILPKADRRKILLEICGDISDEDVIRSDDRLSELKDILRVKGTEDQFYSVEDFRKIAEAAKKDINKKLTEIPARIDEANRNIVNEQNRPWGTVNEEIEKAKEEKESLHEQLLHYSSDSEELARKNLADLNVKLMEARQKHSEIECSKNAERNAIYNSLVRKDSELSALFLQVTEEIKQTKYKISMMEETRKKLLEEYKAKKAETFDPASAICPTCKRELPPDQVDLMIKEFDHAKSEALAKINEAGKKQASKDEIERLKLLVSEKETEIETIKRDLESVKSSTAEVIALNDKTEKFEETDEYRALSAAVAEAKKAIIDSAEKIGEELGKIKAEIAEKEARISSLLNERNIIEMSAKSKSRIFDLEKEEKELSSKYEQAEKGIFLCDLFMRSKVNLVSEKINSKFSTVRFRLFQDQINGGIKEDCEVMIPCSGRLVPYSIANTASRINAGLEIIDTIGQHFEIRLPVFVDNAESVTKMIEISAQMIKLFVSEQDKVLRMETKE